MAQSKALSAQVERRRLYGRFAINAKGVLRYANESIEEMAPLAIDVLDVSKDGLTCKTLTKAVIDQGTPILIDILEPSLSYTLQGKVVTCTTDGDGSRIGIRLMNTNGHLNDLYLGSKPPALDRRNGDRRSKNSPNDEQRQFDRRGVWQGLLTKRYFSHHAWELKKHDVYFFMKALNSAVGNHVAFDGREMVMMASNNYLGLNTHPKVKEAAINAIEKYGTGSSGSNLVGGTYDIHLELEETLARFLRVESVCICISGYVANTTTLTTVLHKEDAVFNDALNHASLIDGSLRNGAYSRIFKHNDMQDLERKLAACRIKHKLVVADAVFSMDGDLAPLPELLRICKKYDAALMLDQAHATGVFGENGRGALEHFHMDGKADIVVGTMSKSLAAIGGFIGGSKELINILRHSARQIFFSTNVSPSACASILAALHIIEMEPERRQTLWRNTEQLRTGLQQMGFNTGTTESPIIPVIFPTEEETNQMAKAILDQDIYVTPIIYPAVKKNQTRIRLSVIATHTQEDIDRTLTAFKRAKARVRVRHAL